jgi:16S rRNA (guanine1207-N2)-methyltransferase
MTVLDIGCGNGILGFTASLENAARVDLVDNNLLAVVSTEKNFTFHNIENFCALPSDGLCAVVGKTYDLILSNPPFHTGSAVDYSASHAIFAQCKNSLNSSGKLILVANRFIRYDHLLEKLFKSVKILQRTNRYHIVSASDHQNM